VFKEVPATHIFNADQTGINLEMVEGRTLDTKGAKTVEAKVQRINATTHSFSLQPLICADGTLLEPTLVCFYEPGGAPVKFYDELSPFVHLDCVWSSSGLFNSDHQVNWMERISQVLPKHSHLMLDSWGGFKRMIDSIDEDGTQIHTIPKRTTGELQPLDVFFNRQLKTFIRGLSSRIRRCHPDFILSQRKNIALLINQVMHQFAAARFRNFVRYSFFRSGYTDERPSTFDTPPQYCLESYPAGASCEKKECGSRTILRCAYCERCLCFKHFLLKMHNCS
jgi:hypothetical protein